MGKFKDIVTGVELEYEMKEFTGVASTMTHPKTAAEWIGIGIDYGTPDGDYSAISIRLGNSVCTFSKGEAEAIFAALREARIEGAAEQYDKCFKAVQTSKLPGLNKCVAYAALSKVAPAVSVTNQEK